MGTSATSGGGGSPRGDRSRDVQTTQRPDELKLPYCGLLTNRLLDLGFRQPRDIGVRAQSLSAKTSESTILSSPRGRIGGNGHRTASAFGRPASGSRIT